MVAIYHAYYNSGRVHQNVEGHSRDGSWIDRPRLEFRGIGGIIRGESSEGVRVMKTKALVEGILAGVVSAIFCYWALITPATFAALAIRRRMPDAWFSGLITWYAMFAVIGISMVVAGVACRMIYKHALTPKA
jgi:predicted phage tail protein